VALVSLRSVPVIAAFADAILHSPDGQLILDRPLLCILVGCLLHQPAGAAVEWPRAQSVLRLLRTGAADVFIDDPQTEEPVADADEGITWSPANPPCRVCKNLLDRKAQRCDAEWWQVCAHQSPASPAGDLVVVLSIRPSRGGRASNPSTLLFQTPSGTAPLRHLFNHVALHRSPVGNPCKPAVNPVYLYTENCV